MTTQPLLPSILITGETEKGRLAKAEEIFGFKINGSENNPDFLLLEGNPSIGIDEVRALRRFLLLKPFGTEKKVVFINEAQDLTLEAQNALLKTLEEPPAHCLIVLSAPESSLLLPTIVSRCQIIQLSAKPQVILTEKKAQELKADFQKLLDLSLPERLALGESLAIYRDRENALSWLDNLSVVLRQELLSHFQKSPPPGNLSQRQLLQIFSLIKETKKYLYSNCNIRLTIEVFLVKL